MISEENAIVEAALSFLQDKFGDNLVAVYGIGSFFNSDLELRDVDIVVLLSNTEKCARKSWTNALFEKQSLGGAEVWLLYGTVEAYMKKEEFKKVSFANWEWGVRCLKHASKLLAGEDIRDSLPEPPYDYDDILMRAAYHLEPTPEWKLRKALEEEEPIDEQLRFTKAIFKFGFFLTAADYPDANIFDKMGILRLLKKSVKGGFISDKVVEFYEDALQSRKGSRFEDFEDRRKEFMKLMVRETLSVTSNSWEDLKGLFSRGFGLTPFSGIIECIESSGWED